MRPALRTVLQVLTALFSPLLLLLALIVKVVTAPFEKPVRRTPEDVAAILERRLSLSPDWKEWDDFTCVHIADPRLEALRAECVAMQNHESGGDPPSYLGSQAAARFRAMVSELRGA